MMGGVHHMMGGGHHMMAFGHHMMGLAIILHHMMSYDGWWFLYLFLCAETLSKKNCSFQQLKAVLFFVPGPWPKGFVEKVLRQKKGQWKGNEGHQAHKGPKTNFVKEPPNLEKGPNKLLERYV